MRLGIVTYNVARNWDVEKIISTLGGLGYEAVELRTTHAHKVEPDMPAERKQQVRDLFAASSVRLLSLGTTCEFQSPDEEVRRKNVAETQEFVKLAHDLGCWGVKVRPNGLPEGVPEDVTIRRIGESLAECGESAKGFGVEIWVEVHGRETQEPRRMRAIMDAANHPNVGVCWNCNDADIQDGSIKQSFELLKDWIWNVHLKELPEYPMRELLSLLRGIGYDRYLLAETAESCEPERYLTYFKALFDELLRSSKA